MEVSRLPIKIFKTLKSLNPYFMDTYFKQGSHSTRKKMI